MTTALHTCKTCGEERPTEITAYGKPRSECIRCRSAKRRVSAQKRNVCINCGGKKEDRNKTHCRACRKKASDRDREIKAQRTNDGLCQRCASPTGKRGLLCTPCREADNARSRQLQRDRKEQGLCVHCGEKTLKHSDTMCEQHYLSTKAKRHLDTGSRKAIATLKDIYDSQNGCCVYSGEPLTLGLNDSVDHRVPVSAAPELARDPANLQWVTREVNTMKMMLSEERFLEICRSIAVRCGSP